MIKLGWRYRVYILFCRDGERVGFTVLDDGYCRLRMIDNRYTLVAHWVTLGIRIIAPRNRGKTLLSESVSIKSQTARTNDNAAV